MAEIIFREMTPADVDAVLNFGGKFFETENSLYIVAETGGEIVGCAGFEFCNEDADGKIFVIAPNFQGRGAGKKLLAALIRNAQNLNFQTMTFDIRASNIPALHIFQKAGFKIVGRRKFFYDGEDAVTLRADLENL